MPAAGWRPLSELIETSDAAGRGGSARVFGDDERAVQADVDDGAELVDRHVGDQADVGEAGAVDDDVERADLLEKALHRILVGDVDVRGGVRVAEFGGAAARAVAVAVGEGDPVSPGRPAPAPSPTRYRTPRRSRPRSAGYRCSSG